MQGVGKDDDGILVLGATNIPWDLDPAVRRRFQKKIYIGLPDIEARKVMLKLNLGNTSNALTEEDYETIASRTEGYLFQLL
jgi:vacuolar protein-sorting-associated protein 4